MAWSISMSAEGRQNVLCNLEQLSEKQLIDALCDDRFELVEHKGGIEHATRAAEALRRRLATAPHDVLVQSAYELIEENNLCDNGGSNVWIDREGFHTVSTSHEHDETCEDDCNGTI